MTQTQMIPEGREETKLEAVAKILPWYAFKWKDFSEITWIPVIKIKDIKPPYVDLENTSLLNVDAYDSQKVGKYKLKKWDYLVAMTGATIWKVWRITSDKVAYLNQRVAKIDGIEWISDRSFVYYLIFWKRFENYIHSFSAWSSAQQNISADGISYFPILRPPFPEQKAIASVLSSLDDKIELLREQNKILEKIAQTIFYEWFVKFAFPGATGEMEESELGDIPKGWRVGKLWEVIKNYDSQRIPITRDKREGWEYPYYWATGINDYVKDYIFEWIYTLLWEDWSVIKENGRPFTQYVWWKIWVNNHAHVLQGTNWFSTELIKIILDRTDIFPYVNWAVQLKINQTNMNSIPVIIPEEIILIKINQIIQPLFTKIRDNTNQIQALSKTRDTLLPRLMSGEVRVKF